MNKLAVASFLPLLAFALGVPLSCPSPEDMPSHCSCKPITGLPVLCQNFEDTAHLVKALEYFRTQPVQNMLLHGLNLKEALPDDAFRDTGLLKLRIEQSQLTFSKSAFEGLDGSLKELILEDTDIKCSKGFILAHLTQLTKLHVKRIPLLSVSDEWLNGKIPNVRIIVLDGNDINELGNEAFAKLKHLETISVAENTIRNVRRSMLPVPAHSLTSIDFSRNKISDLPGDFFSEMPALSTVVFSNNDLTTLPESTWKSVWARLDSVWLVFNELVCDSELDWIKRSRKPRELEGVCVAPSEFFGKSVSEVYKA